MKNFLFVLTLISFTSFAEDSVKCTYKLEENFVKCPLIGSCPEKELRESKHEEIFTVIGSEVVKKSIPFNKIIFQSQDKSKSNKNVIFVFGSDQRFASIKKEDVGIASLETQEKLNIEVSNQGQQIRVISKTSLTTNTMNLGGYNQEFNTMRTHFIYSEDDQAKSLIKPMLITCQRVKQEMLLEKEARENIKDDLEQQKQNKEGGKEKSKGEQD